MWRVGNNFKYWNREGLIEDEVTVKFCKSWPRKEKLFAISKTKKS